MESIYIPNVNEGRTKSQMQLYREAEKKINDQNAIFIDMVNDGMTKKELQALIDKRPDKYGRFERWISKLK